MRILGIGNYNELGSVYLRLIGEGHEVKVHIAEAGSHDVLGGLVELTAPGRAVLVNQGLKRCGVDAGARQYFALHATLDVKHSEAWNREILISLVEADPSVAPLIAEGALARLEAGRRCFARYRRELGLCSVDQAA